ncbi:MAG: LPS export ABC transporter periplasmic protein LptC [Caulobacterales bacterium]
MALDQDLRPSHYEYTGAPRGRGPSLIRVTLVRSFRIILPLIALGLTAALLWVGVFQPGKRATEQAATRAPIELIEPRFVGEDNQGRAYVVTAARAQRETGDQQRIQLTTPNLLRDEGKPDQLRVQSKAAVYDQESGKVFLSGNVTAASSLWNAKSDKAVFDTRTGNIETTGRSRSGVSVRLGN